jgi:hypothetical protein
VVLNSAAGSSCFSRSTAALRSSRVKELTSRTSNFGELPKARFGSGATAESSEAYRGEFARENETLRPENTIHARDLVKRLRLNVVRPVTVRSYA